MTSQNRDIPESSLGKYSDEPWEHPAFACMERGDAPRQRVCLCIFVLNERRRLESQLRKMHDKVAVVDLIVADGGSSDGTSDPEWLFALGVRTVLVKKGPGRLGGQMRMAFAYALAAGYEAVVVVDGNDKDDVVSALPLFLSKLSEGYDHVQGSRFVPGGRHENTPISRYFAVKVIHSPLIALFSGFRYTDTTNGFRGYSGKFLRDEDVRLFRDSLAGYELHYYLAIQAARRCFRVAEVPVTRVYPKGEKTPTKISPIKGNLNVLRRLIWTCLGYYDYRPFKKH